MKKQIIIAALLAIIALLSGYTMTASATEPQPTINPTSATDSISQLTASTATDTTTAKPTEHSPHASTRHTTQTTNTQNTYRQMKADEVPQEQLDAVEKLYKLGLFQEVTTNRDGTPNFALNYSTTRIQAYTILIRAIGEEQTAIRTKILTDFQDLTTNQHPIVAYSLEQNMIHGISRTRFSPNDQIRADHFLTAVLSILDYTCNSSDLNWCESWTKTDTLKITNNQFNDEYNTLTRGEMAVIILNMLTTTLNNQEITLIEQMIENEIFQELHNQNRINSGKLITAIETNDKEIITDAVMAIINGTDCDYSHCCCPICCDCGSLFFDRTANHSQEPIFNTPNQSNQNNQTNEEETQTDNTTNNNTSTTNNENNSNNNTNNENNSGNGNNADNNSNNANSNSNNENNANNDNESGNDSDSNTDTDSEENTNDCTCDNHNCESENDCTCDNHNCETVDDCTCGNHNCETENNCNCNKTNESNDCNGNCTDPNCKTCNPTTDCEEGNCNNTDCSTCNPTTDCDNDTCNDPNCKTCNPKSNHETGNCTDPNCPTCNPLSDCDTGNCNNPNCPNCTPSDTWPKSLLDVTDDGSPVAPNSDARWVKVRDINELPTDADGNQIYTDAIKTTSCFMFQQTRVLYEFDRSGIYHTLSFTAYNTTDFIARIQIFDHETEYLLWSINLEPHSSLEVTDVNISKADKIQITAELINAPTTNMHYENAVYLCDPRVDRGTMFDGYTPNSFLSHTDVGRITTSGNTSRWWKVINRDELPRPTYTEALKTDYLSQTRRANSVIYTLDSDEYKALGFNIYNQADFNVNVRIENSETGTVLWETMLEPHSYQHKVAVDISDSTTLEIFANLVGSPFSAPRQYNAIYICDPILSAEPITNNANKCCDTDCECESPCDADCECNTDNNNDKTCSCETNCDCDTNCDCQKDCKCEAVCNSDTDCEDPDCDRHFRDRIITPYFTDPNFLTEVRRVTRKADGDIYLSDVINIQNIIVQTAGIRDFAGIEHFQNLTELSCIHHPNSVEVLDVSRNTNLRTLSLPNHRLTSLDLSNNSNLTNISLRNNNISELILPVSSSLQLLSVDSNPINNLDLSNQTRLETLSARNTPLRHINLENQPLLNILMLSSTEISEIDLSAQRKLEIINVFHTNLSQIDVTNQPMLRILAIDNTNIGEINLSNNNLLTTLIAESANLNSIDLSNQPALTQLHIGNNQLSNIDLSNNPLLQNLTIGRNNLSTLDITRNPNLHLLYAESNNIDALLSENNTRLSLLWMPNNNLTSLDLSNFSSLDTLNIQNNRFPSRDSVTLPSHINWDSPDIVFGSHRP